MSEKKLRGPLTTTSGSWCQPEPRSNGLPAELKAMSQDHPHSFETWVAKVGGVAIPSLHRDLDLATHDRAPDAFGALQTVVPNHHELDLMDSTGVRFILGAKTLSESAGVRMVVLNGSSPAHRTMDLTASSRAST